MSWVSTGWSSPKRSRSAAMVSAVATPDSEAMTSAASPGMSCSSRKSSTMMPSTVGPAWIAVRRSVVRMRRPILMNVSSSFSSPPLGGEAG